VTFRRVKKIIWRIEKLATFWDKWLNFWDDEVREKAEAKSVIHEDELKWMSTRQDKRVALLAAPETGFVTMGGVSMLVEIPVGWRTGKCSMGEVVMYIIEGEGCSVIDGLRYDWEEGAVVAIPYGATYQHYNTGDKTVRIIAANAIHIERYCGLAKLVQYEDCSKIPKGEPKEPKAPSDILFRHGRIVLHAKDAPTKYASEEERKSGYHYHHKRVELMNTPGTGFNTKEIEITTIMCDDPFEKSGLTAEAHGHMEAHVYILKGEGYSIVDEVKVPWKKGTLIHVQGPQTMHQHWNMSDEESGMLRIHFGMRAHWYEDIAKRTFPYIHAMPDSAASPSRARHAVRSRA